MPKRRRDGGGTAEPLPQYLYLVWDDWDWGYSIRRVDLSSDFDSVGCAGELPMPRAIWRLEAPREAPWSLCAWGTKIVAMHNRVDGMYTELRRFRPFVIDGLVPAFDVRARELTFLARPKRDTGQPVTIPVGDRLFALCGSSFQLLDDPHGEWRELPPPTFDSSDVFSIAVHPDEPTIFLSTACWVAVPGTYCFRLEADGTSGEWRFLGDWTLPFNDRGHFDRELNAFVGVVLLHPDDAIGGHITACPVPSHDATSCPAWKVSKEKLGVPDSLHIGATLVYTGRASKFVLVEAIRTKDSGSGSSSDSVAVEDEHRLRLTTFSLRYGGDGDLTTGDSSRVRRYQLRGAPSWVLLNSPVAFWM